MKAKNCNDSQSGFLQSFISKVDGLGRRLEARWTLYPTAFLLALLLLLISSIYVTPALNTINWGECYQELSVTPFNFKVHNPVRLRILTPLLGYILFFRARFYIFLPLLTGVLFLASIYIYFRKNEFSQCESLGMSALMAFSSPILFVLHFQGYTDTTSYFLLFLSLIFIEKPYIWVTLFSLSLLNHESNLFAAPWLLFLALRQDKSFFKCVQVIVLLLISLLPLLLFRHYVTSQCNVLLSKGFYLSVQRMIHCWNTVARYLPLGFFEAFKLFWFFPMAAFLQLVVTKQMREAIWLCLVVTCASAQLLFATDTSRLLCLAFPAILMGAKRVRSLWGRDMFVRRLWLIIGLNFLVPQYYIGQSTAIPFYPLPVSLVLKFVFGVDAWGLWWV